MFTDDAGKGGIAAGGPRNSEDSTRRTGGDLVQLITPAGERISHPEFDPWLQDVSDEQLGSLYEDMVVIRRIDAEATALQRQGELALWPPLLGQEASQIGSARALREDDFVFPSYRDNGVGYCRGVKVEDLVRAWRGSASSGWDPYTVNVATQQIIIGSQSLHATGYAMGIQNDGADCVAVAYFGDGATSEGDVNEAMVFAASFQVPVVFFCQNNHWAISEPVRAAVPHPVGGPCRGLRHSQHAGGRKRRPRRHGGHAHRPGPRQAGRRSYLHRGSDLPDGPAHDGG